MASDPNGINQLGCVYAAQGFEFDYVGVIFGRDLRWDPASQDWIGDSGASHDTIVKRSGDHFHRPRQAHLPRPPHPRHEGLLRVLRGRGDGQHALHKDRARMTMTPAGMIYGPTSSGKMYLCSKEHRGANHRKSQWAASVPPVTEYGIFQMADGYNWVDDFGHYWGVLGSDAPKLGSAGEKLAKFPANASEAPAPWHGYPVSPRVRGVEDSPPFSFVEEWWKTGGITRTIARRIQRRKL